MEKSTTNNPLRILLVVTETSHLSGLWQAVVENRTDAHVELTTIFISDDRWHRVASLSFTQEVSRLGGASADFTTKRAEQINRHVVDQVRLQLQQLSDEAELQLVFEVLSEHLAERIHQFMAVEKGVLIAPANLKNRPIYAELAHLSCPILLVDTEE